MFKQIKKWFNDPINEDDMFGVEIRKLYQFFRNWRRDGKIPEEEKHLDFDKLTTFHVKQSYNDREFLSFLQLDLQTKISELGGNSDNYVDCELYINEYIKILDIVKSLIDKISNENYIRNKEKIESQLKEEQEFKNCMVDHIPMKDLVDEPFKHTDDQINPFEHFDPYLTKTSEINTPILPSNNFSISQNVVKPDETIVNNLIETRQDISILPHESDTERENLIADLTENDCKLTARVINNSSREVEVEIVEEHSTSSELDNEEKNIVLIPIEVYDKVFEKIKELIVEQMGQLANKITKDSKFNEDLFFDSLDNVEVIMRCEEEFGIAIEDGETDKIETVGEAVNFLVEIKKVYQKMI